MKIIMYGSHLCQDVIYALTKLKDQDVTIELRNITSNFGYLKEFMHYRETDPMFKGTKERDELGIPFMIMEDGTKTFDFKDVLKKLK